ncbi:MAG: hypothetical protein ABJF04_19140 [Reichenbachiella sp.]|uniref:hypothetical protein n=1 Tax=Reichenbachiella sp. TaxID=2184521 RepID=UPI003264E036
MNKCLLLLLFAISFSCLAPDEINISVDTDTVIMDQLLKSSIAPQEHYQIKKEVTLDGEQEVVILSFDTLILIKDLKSITESSFARLIRSTNYNKTKIEKGWLYERKIKEKKGPVSVSFIQDDDVRSALKVRFKDKNLLYESDKKIELIFEKERLSQYQISGSRKLVGMRLSSYSIKATIVQP